MKHITKLALCAVFFCATMQTAVAQMSFSHSLGLSLYYATTTASPAFLYSPRLNVAKIGEDKTISIGTHLGAWIALNSRTGGGVALDLPLVVEYNFGHASYNDADAEIGGFVGAGYGINLMGSSSYGGNSSSGPLVNAGFRAVLFGQPVTIRASYLLNTTPLTGHDVIGLGFGYNLGVSR
jgi:hypothetical protein